MSMTIHVSCSMCWPPKKQELDIEWERHEESPHYRMEDVWKAIRKKRWIVQEPLMDIYCCKECAQ